MRAKKLIIEVPDLLSYRHPGKMSSPSFAWSARHLSGIHLKAAQWIPDKPSHKVARWLSRMTVERYFAFCRVMSLHPFLTLKSFLRISILWLPAYAGMTALFTYSLAAEEANSSPSPYSLAQDIQKLQQDLASCENNLMQSEKMQHQLRIKIAHTLPAFIRYVRRNSLEFMTRPQHQHKAAKERALIGAINTHLFQRFAHEQFNYSENAALYTMTRNALNIKKDVSFQLVTLHKDYIQTQKEKIKSLENAEKEKINNKKLSVNELINESLIARGQKPLLSASKDGLAIVRLTLPLQGKIVGLYDIHTHYSTHGRGIVLEGQKGGAILAPMHGVVKYIGKFGRHDPIAILNNGDLTTMVIIGAESFSVQPGQTIYMGQTLGKLPGYGANAPRLYMELRHKGKYIDPTPFFSDNGSN